MRSFDEVAVELRHLGEHGVDDLGGEVVGTHRADSEPFMARPMGVRAVATMTASASCVKLSIV
jgi:hypothetical protein